MPNEDGTTSDILTNIVWGAQGKGTTGESVDQSILDALNGVVNKDLNRDKLNEIEKYVNLGTPYTTITVDGNGPASVDLPSGYYLIRDVPDSQTGKDDAYTTYITVVVKNYTIKPKSAKPTVDKAVAETSESWGETADHAINESFQFRLTANIPADSDLADYSAYKLVFTDTMSEGVTFENVQSVTVGGTAIDTSKYAVKGVSNGEAGKTWTLTIEDIIPLLADGKSLKDGCSVVVTYNAHLNENAVSFTASAEKTTANSNKVVLEYSNNPNTTYSGDLGKTTEDYVWVFTYEVDNTKVTGENAPLAGAGFRLYQGDTEIALIYDNTNEVYYPAKAGETGVEMTSANNGQFNIKGLDQGEYTLRETTTPAGYNSCADVTVKISASHGENADGGSAYLTMTNSNTSNTIINQAGHSLPTTGGAGTTVLYWAGSLLIMAAGILLSVRRMKA